MKKEEKSFEKATKVELKKLHEQSYKIKIFNWLRLFALIYLFIFSIELIKKASFFLSKNIDVILSNSVNPIKAISAGWFATSIIQSSDAVGTITAAFAGNNLISLPVAIYILIGSSLGTTITAIIISLVIASKKKRDFRHGFEIAFSYSIYSFILVVLVLILEYFLGAFSKSSLFLATAFHGKISLLKIPSLINVITDPIIDLFFTNVNKILLIAIGFVILILVLRYIGKSIIAVLGGEEKTRKRIDSYFNSKYKAYFLGVGLTAILFSSSITIGLLVPLAVARVINLKKALPFILGADLGTTSSLFVASLFLGNVQAMACFFAFALFAILGAIIFLPNINLLFKLTKYLSKKTIHISRKKALIILLIFILLPLAIVLLF